VLAEVMEAIRRVPALTARLGANPTLAAAKFLSPVRPGSVLSIELHPEAGTGRGVRFDVRCNGVVAVTGRWTAVQESA
jgi:acyl dehydratase